MTTRKKTTGALILAVALAGAAGAFPGQAPQSAATPRRAVSARTPMVEKVADTARVCMVNDMDMGKAQIPVVVGGRTYYGCCAMCKDRLSRDAGARNAVDPVSGKVVDKARAVIGKRPDGSVVYFESETNLRKYATSR